MTAPEFRPGDKEGFAMTAPEFRPGDKVCKAYTRGAPGSAVYTVVSTETIFDWKTAKHVPRVNIESASGKLYARAPDTLVKANENNGQKEGSSMIIPEFKHTTSPRQLGRDYVTASIKWETYGGNKHPHFSICGTVYGPERISGETPITIDGKSYWPHSGGQVREAISLAFPALVPFLRWHLCDPDGPMYYRENGLYQAEFVFGVSKWETPNYDTRKAFAETVVLGAVEGDAFPAVILSDDELSPAAHKAEVHRQVGAWLDARRPALLVQFASDMRKVIDLCAKGELRNAQA